MKYAFVFLLALLAGCSAPYQMLKPSGREFSSTEILDRYLTRNLSWESLSCRVKIKARIGDTTMTAKGTLLYVGNEKFNLSFARPFNQIIGDLYVTPDQLIYWGNGRSQSLFSAKDTIHIGELVEIDLPDWDPRDLLPFPISGRTGGFQVIAEESDVLDGECGPAVYRVTLDRQHGAVSAETIRRQDHEPVYKSYAKNYSVNGWPIPSRIRCEDASGHVRLDWQLYDIQLKSTTLPGPFPDIPTNSSPDHE